MVDHNSLGINVVLLIERMEWVLPLNWVELDNSTINPLHFLFLNGTVTNVPGFKGFTNRCGTLYVNVLSKEKGKQTSAYIIII